MRLRNKDKQHLIEIFQPIPNIEVWAYGSRVNGTAHEGSDLDLVIRTADLQEMPLSLFLELKQKIRESNIPIVVELFDWARLPQTFKQNILQHYEVLFSNLPNEISHTEK